MISDGNIKTIIKKNILYNFLCVYTTLQLHTQKKEKKRKDKVSRSCIISSQHCVVEINC